MHRQPTPATPPHARAHTNSLARESSPYLLQHAHNPVDWQPWGDAAFAEARRRDVPIFLSIGYSTCYWCHVMERESFEHEPTARLMNERFVCIKVDREERPEVDDIYMAATLAVNGQGGWPMSVFLEPARLKPFWAGTYFPLHPMHGRPSFRQVLEGMSNAWRTQRAEVLAQADHLAHAVADHVAQSRTPHALSSTSIDQAVRALLRIFDRTNGGFGGAPKFPQPVYLDLLLTLRDAINAPDQPDLAAAIDLTLKTTLDKMLAGGMHDQIGGGFHRYAVDELWLVPHFEKMLYDQAQLALVYARAATLYDGHDRDQYARVVHRTLDYVLREMTDHAGAFHSAQDAEVDGREGLNYLWLPADIHDALRDAPGVTADDAAFALDVLGLNSGTNFQDPHHPDEPRRNVLRLDDRPDRIALLRGESPSAFTSRLDRVAAALLSLRDRRKQPHLDDKVLAAWNGLMIAALVAGHELATLPALTSQPPTTAPMPYLDAATRAARFITSTMLKPDGTLTRSWRRGIAGPDAVLEDYAALALGLAALAHHAPEFAGHAAALAHRAMSLFGSRLDVPASDHPAIVLHDTPADRDDLFVRSSTTYDGAVPSGASIMLHALLALGDHEATITTLRGLSAAIAANPLATANSTRALLIALRTVPNAAQSLDAGERSAAPADADDAFTPVEVYASAERLEVGPDAPATFRVVLRIAPGYHINAAQLLAHDAPDTDRRSVAQLVPLRVGLISGRGVAVYADYPAGDPITTDAPPATDSPSPNAPAGAPPAALLVHTGTIEFDVAVEHAPDVGVPGAGRDVHGEDRPVLGITFQACTDTACLAPMTAELDIAIDLID